VGESEGSSVIITPTRAARDAGRPGDLIILDTNRVTRRRHRSATLKTAASAIAFIASAYSIFALLARLLYPANIVVLLVSVTSPYAPVLAAIGLVAAAVARRAALCIATVAILLGATAVQIPWHYGNKSRSGASHSDLRVLSSNLRKGRADPNFFVDFASASADVIAVSELTDEEAGRFTQAGMERSFPYSSLRPGPGASGIGVYSRYPLHTDHSVASSSGIIAAGLLMPGVRTPPLVAAVHITSPLAFRRDSFDAWQRGISQIKTELAAFASAAGCGPVIVAGDFNSTPDMRQFRDLLTNGYRDTVEQLGGGFAPTFPVGFGVLPPLITIDHVLTRNATASSTQTVHVPGSDHRALLATVRVSQRASEP
jgi:endonuclease/exonuclease/phosphatase (EEP) superfamily protein YafD